MVVNFIIFDAVIMCLFHFNFGQNVDRKEERA